jgi:hypothetical protein
MGAAGRRGGGRANAARGSITTTDSLPIDAAEQIAAAYQRRPPRYPVTPETVGLPIAPLANQNTPPRRPVNRQHTAPDAASSCTPNAPLTFRVVSTHIVVTLNRCQGPAAGPPAEALADHGVKQR